MGIYMRRHKVTFVTVPKCACTSMQHFCFHVENGRPYKPIMINGRRLNIHEIGYTKDEFAKTPFKSVEDHWKAAIIRDPVSRMVSAYRSQVLHYKRLETGRARARLEEAGLSVTPSFSEFVSNLPGYQRAVNAIARHTKPLSFFLGTDPSWYDALYDLSEIDALAAEINRRCKTDVPLRHRQKEGPVMGADAVTEADATRVRELFETDYTLWAPYWTEKYPDLSLGQVQAPITQERAL